MPIVKNLPSSKDKFWEGADVNVNKLVRKKCEHYFERKTGLIISCKNCGMGFILSGGKFYLKQNHIYKGKRFVI